MLSTPQKVRILTLAVFYTLLVYVFLRTNCHTLMSIDQRICTESQAKLYLEFEVTLSGNITALANCGPVLHCDTSPCNYPYIIGQSYYSFGNFYLQDCYFNSVTILLAWLGCVVTVIVWFANGSVSNSK